MVRIFMMLFSYTSENLKERDLITFMKLLLIFSSDAQKRAWQIKHLRSFSSPKLSHSTRSMSVRWKNPKPQTHIITHSLNYMRPGASLLRSEPSTSRMNGFNQYVFPVVMTGTRLNAHTRACFWTTTWRSATDAIINNECFQSCCELFSTSLILGLNEP